MIVDDSSLEWKLEKMKLMALGEEARLIVKLPEKVTNIFVDICSEEVDLSEIYISF